MKSPRDISGDEIITALGRIGFNVTRQTGSHARLTRIEKGVPSHLTVPRHASLKAGTLNAIVRELGALLEVDRNEVLERLFGKR
ncbi:MAG: type II toxin-antitoxin system HicA family toxin [Wenzhouxiangellaceae bacterium]|nr:type II toxin-antitoxin system HicA family toxin [Wenzhouxiangellaceae bacterium]